MSFVFVCFVIMIFCVIMLGKTQGFCHHMINHVLLNDTVKQMRFRASLSESALIIYALPL